MLHVVMFQLEPVLVEQHANVIQETARQTAGLTAVRIRVEVSYCTSQCFQLMRV